MTTKRPPSQLELDLPTPGRGEAPRRIAREAEVVTATSEPENPASTAYLMEAVCDPENIEAALRAVVRNKGAPGVDGITVQQLPGILKARWPEIEDQLLQGRYQPQPVRRVQIPKPAGGTTRPRHSNRDRPRDPTSGAAAAAAAVGPDVQRAQLRLPAGSLRPASGGAGAGLRHRRLSVRRRYRLGEIFRPS